MTPDKEAEREKLIEECGYKWGDSKGEVIADFILAREEELIEEVKKGMKQALINEELRQKIERLEATIDTALGILKSGKAKSDSIAEEVGDYLYDRLTINEVIKILEGE